MAPSRGLTAFAVAVAASVTLAIAAPLARADGAFPDSLQLLVPADRPNEIVLATNFGLAITDDNAVTFHLVCEAAIATQATLYSMGAPPSDTLYAVAPMRAGLVASFDDGCVWTSPTSSTDPSTFTDVFPDAIDPMRVVAIAAFAADAGAFTQVAIASSDGGRSFGAPIFTAPAGTLLSGIETAPSPSKTLFLTALSYDAKSVLHPLVIRSLDGGATFTTIDELAALGPNIPGLIAVDPVNQNKVYVRVNGAMADSLAITSDGGATFRIALTLPGHRMSAFLRRADGSLIVTSVNGDFFVSQDGGTTFTPRFDYTVAKVHARALAERGGLLYVAADNAADGFALGTSSDGGATFSPLWSYESMCGPSTCEPVHSTCAVPWTVLVGELGISPAPACRPDGGNYSPPDLGSSEAPHGCGCTVAARSSLSAFPLLALVAAVFIIRRKSQSARRR